MKPIKEIQGITCRPICVGERAFIDGNDPLIISNVIHILEENKAEIIFETLNTIYRLKQAA